MTPYKNSGLKKKNVIYIYIYIYIFRFIFQTESEKTLPMVVLEIDYKNVMYVGFTFCKKDDPNRKNYYRIMTAGNTKF